MVFKLKLLYIYISNITDQIYKLLIVEVLPSSNFEVVGLGPNQTYTNYYII